MTQAGSVKPPPIQAELIRGVRERAADDSRVLAALMYGSFAKGEGDRFSDVEFYVFVRDEALASLNRHEWVSAIAPTFSFFVNEFGTDVAIFRNLVRGEFHFEPHSRVDRVRSWAPIEKGAAPEDMIILDRVGELTANLGFVRRAELAPEAVQELYDRLLNWFLLGCNVLRRGERARALDALAHIHRFLLQLARVRADALAHWLTPSRNLERELDPRDLRRFAACTGSLSPGSLERAYRNTWSWSRELIDDLSHSWDLESRDDLAEEIAGQLSDWLEGEEA